MVKKILLITCVVFVCYGARAQDALFTQFHYAPVYLNPAFTGGGKNNLRLSGLTKMQWFNLYKPFKYFTGAVDLSLYDEFLRNIANLGLIVNHSSKGNLSNTNVSGIVGRSFGTNNGDCSNWFLSLALQAGYNFSRVNTKDFVFADQIDQTGLTGDASQVDLFANATNKNYFDMSSGFVLTFKDFMLGAAVHHLNEPNISFIGKPEDAKLPRKITGHLSYMFDNGNIKLKPTVMLQLQGKSSAFIMGTLFDFNDFPLQLGCWYRNNVGFAYNNAFSIGISWKWGQEKTVSTNANEYSNRGGLSYDAEMNKPGAGTTFGSMEFGLQRDIVIGYNSKCPTATSGVCSYRFPWEFF